MHRIPPTRTRTTRRRRLAVVAVVAGLLLAGCRGGTDGDDGAGAGSPGEVTGREPILLAAVASLTGPAALPDATAAAAAVFTAVNDDGGVRGRPVTYRVVDDRSDPEEATVAAARLVADPALVALVGGGSSVDCRMNAGLYSERRLPNLGGTLFCGSDAPTVAALNTGPFVGSLSIMSHLVGQLGVTNLCVAGRDDDTLARLRDVYVPLWQHSTGRSARLIAAGPGEDVAAVVRRTAEAGCDGVVAAFGPADVVAFGRAAADAGLTGRVRFAMLGTVATPAVLADLGAAGEGWVSAADFLPVGSGRSDDLAAFTQLMKKAGIEPTPVAQSGYLAARAVLSVLDAMQDDVTRDSFRAALASLSYESELLGRPARWVPFEGAAQLNTSVRILQVRDGTFRAVSDWVHWPPGS
jgi:branched-chain amino acid transport system substrate-binding protein